MSIQRVAIVFDDQVRPETSGVYCRRALGELVEVVTHFQPSELERIPRQEFDLYLNIDDGLEYRWPAELRSCAWWAIDTHMDFAWCLTKARDFDYVFAAQRDGAERLRQEGIASAQWLPLACDPAIHQKHEVPKEYDLCFVGNLFPGPRTELVGMLQRRYPKTFVGCCYFEEMARAYSASRIVFNRSLKNDVNMRVFEALACGSLLVTNDLAENGQAELFRDGVHLATYGDAEELLDKVAYYLKHEALREGIAAAGRDEVLAKHTYRHRMQHILAEVEKRLHAKTAPRSAPFAAPQDLPYFEFDRPELVALVPESARWVLDIGCGAGKLGEAIKARQPAEVVGIELEPRAAARARGRLDRVVEANAEEWEADFAQGSFDCIVCGDVLEHLREPARLLQRARGWLAPDGRLVASIPNVRHHSVVRGLLEGNWTYERAGLLDRTHLRFFTRRSMESLLDRSGFRIEALEVVPGPGYEEWQAQGRPGEVSIGKLHVGNLSPQEAEEFYVYQYLVRAQPAPPTPPASAPRAAVRIATPGRAKSGRQRRGKGQMRFTQDFVRDFAQVDFFSPVPFALARFADGERAILTGTPIAAADGWGYDGQASRFKTELEESLRYSAPDYYIGISDSCCDREAHEWYLQRVRVPLAQLTFSNLFVNANYRRFRELNLKGTVIIASAGGDFQVPEDAVGSGFDLDALVEELLAVDHPILVSAGPASCVLIHKYWTRAKKKQVIVDVGSALDERTKGCRSRGYHDPASRTAYLTCTW